MQSNSQNTEAELKSRFNDFKPKAMCHKQRPPVPGLCQYVQGFIFL